MSLKMLGLLVEDGEGLSGCPEMRTTTAQESACYGREKNSRGERVKAGWIQEGGSYQRT